MPSSCAAAAVTGAQHNIAAIAAVCRFVCTPLCAWQQHPLGTIVTSRQLWEALVALHSLPCCSVSGSADAEVRPAVLLAHVHGDVHADSGSVVDDCPALALVKDLYVLPGRLEPL